MANYWIKLYNEILDDPKMATLPDNLWRRVIELFLFAGKLYADGILPDTKQIAWGLRMNENVLETDLKQLVTTGIIDKTDTGWFIPKFKQRQDPTPGKERTAQFRKKEQTKQYNGIVTELKQNVTQITDNILQITDNITDTEDAGLFSESSKLSELSKMFEVETKMPVRYPEKWMTSIRNMFEAGVTPQILKETIYKMKNPDKGGKVLTISGPWSCEGMAIDKTITKSGPDMRLNN